MRKNPKLIDKWLRSLPPDARSAVQALSVLADSRGLPLYLVGGPLRDLLLDRPSLDIDLAVEGDAISLASQLAASLDVKPRLHATFGTATIPGHGWHIDLATARSETYRHPGALPQVAPAAIEDDLRRRDFSINAMALRLNGRDAGALLDPTGGQDDLRDGIIRVLHERSFQDDATRIIRAARYAARFGFKIEPRTLKWLRRDVSFLGSISPARLHHEFARIFREAAPSRALLYLDDLRALCAVHPALSFTPAQAAGLDWLLAHHPHALPAAGWPFLARPATPLVAAAIARRLGLTRAQTAAVEAMPVLRTLVQRLGRPDLRRSELAAMLEPFPPAAVWALAASEHGPVRNRCLDYLERLRHVRPALRGDDIIALGIPRGPEVGEMLRRLRVAKLDGEVRTRKDEERFVRNILAGATTP